MPVSPTARGKGRPATPSHTTRPFILSTTVELGLHWVTCTTTTIITTILLVGGSDKICIFSFRRYSGRKSQNSVVPACQSSPHYCTFPRSGSQPAHTPHHSKDRAPVWETVRCQEGGGCRSGRRVRGAQGNPWCGSRRGIWRPLILKC